MVGTGPLCGSQGLRCMAGSLCGPTGSCYDPKTQYVCGRSTCGIGVPYQPGQACAACGRHGQTTSPSAAQVSKTHELNESVVALHQAGKYAEAVPLAQQELAILEKSLGANHPRIAAPLNNLAELYVPLGRYADAEPLLKRAIAINEKTFGPNHASVATNLNNLALLYVIEGRNADAEPLFKRSLAIREKASGPHHPEVATVLENLASLYRTEARYAEAESLLKRSLEIREKALGPDRSEVSYSLNSLAELYFFTDRYAEAEPLFKRSLAIREKVSGPAHPAVARILSNLAVLYSQMGRYADAEPLFKRSLAIREKALGPDNPDVSEALNGLAVIHEQEGRYADAEPLYKRSLAITEKTLGPNHPWVGVALSNLAMLYAKQGRYADAEPLEMRALGIGEKALGPDHPNVAGVLHSLAQIYRDQARYLEAEPLLKRSLAILERALRPDSPKVANLLNAPISLYGVENKYVDALPLVRRTIAQQNSATWVALPVLFGAVDEKIFSEVEALDDSLNVFQHASQTSAAEALNALAIRFSVGDSRLAKLVRQDQDLAGEAGRLDKAILEAVSKDASKRDLAAEKTMRDRVAAIGKERASIEDILTKEFPDYAALSKPKALRLKDIQSLLADDEALIVIDLEAKSFIWAVSKTSASWKELAVNADEVTKRVSALRALLDPLSRAPFDPMLSFNLYRELFGSVDDLVAAKPRWSVVVNGSLTSLPLHVLVTSDPAGKALKDVDWLTRSHAVTVLPSIGTLRVLRGKAELGNEQRPMVGFANPVFDRDPQSLKQNAQIVAEVTVARGMRGQFATVADLKTMLAPLPETADELRQVAESVHADAADVVLGLDATETRVKRTNLDQYRIVYFATHGLLAGDVAEFAKLKAEPALVLTLPEKPTEVDDGLLTASEIAQLKLDAEWVVLSACNTAAGDKPGAEALSGLARAFFYAGARSLIVSNWEVETKSAVALMVGTFAALAADPKLSHAKALRNSMLAVIANAEHPEWADPKFWAPFVGGGEPAKPPN